VLVALAVIRMGLGRMGQPVLAPFLRGQVSPGSRAHAGTRPDPGHSSCPRTPSKRMCQSSLPVAGDNPRVLLHSGHKPVCSFIVVTFIFFALVHDQLGLLKISLL